jgi:uncharacterized protein YcbK (DUF882 family)
MGWHVTGKVAHRNLLSLRSRRAGYCCSIAALLIFFGCESLQSVSADGETRTISFHHIHTGEDLSVTYKVNGRYDDDALRKINHVLRDWRESENITMDPHLIDLLWEVHREVGAKEPIWVVCGYRSPDTNTMLRRRSSGVAQHSQHMLGKAIDFYIPGVPLDQLRAAGLRAQRGGVGYYPTSGAPFVHLDTGSVRHWPRMPEEQLASVLARGPLSSQSGSDGGSRSRMPSFLAKIFGGRDEAEDAAAAAAARTKTAAAAPRAPAEKPAVVAASAIPLPQAKPPRPATYQVASAAPAPMIIKAADRYEGPSATSTDVPAAKGYAMASAVSKPVRLAQATGLAVQTDTSANDVINERGYWRGPIAEPADAPQARTAPAPAPRRATAAMTASADPTATVSASPWPLIDRAEREPVPSALAYAAQPTPIAVARALPIGSGSMGSTTSRAVPVAVPPDTTVAVKRSDDRPSSVVPTRVASIVRVGDRFNDPWMRAMIVSPSAQNFLKTTLLGPTDFRTLGPHMLKPSSTMVMMFSKDPHLGMAFERFDGTAVVFVSTATFSTAAVR